MFYLTAAGKKSSVFIFSVANQLPMLLCLKTLGVKTNHHAFYVFSGFTFFSQHSLL